MQGKKAQAGKKIALIPVENDTVYIINQRSKLCCNESDMKGSKCMVRHNQRLDSQKKKKKRNFL